MIKGFIPTSKKEIRDQGWRKVDVIIVTGDAYIDHSAYELATIGKYLIDGGIKVAILDMPDISKDEEMTKLGKPELFFLVYSGEQDSMLSNYSVYKKYKSTDPYLPGGERNVRPDRAVIKYTNKIKQLFKGSTTIIGGIEAAGRRFAHYDFWADKVRKPILFDSKADMLLFGSMEINLLKIAKFMKNRKPVSGLTKMPGTAYISKELPDFRYEELPTYEEAEDDTIKFREMSNKIHSSLNPHSSPALVQKVMDRYLVVNKPYIPLIDEEMDQIYNLSYARRPHKKYTKEIPAYNNVKDVIFSHRGDFAGLSYSQASISQGIEISSRSPRSIFREAHYFSKSKLFNNVIRNMAGSCPNMFGIKLSDTKASSRTDRESFLFPDIFPNLRLDPAKRIDVMNKIDDIEGVRNNFYAGGIDYRLITDDLKSFKDLVMRRVGGYMVVNIGSCDDKVRKLMHLPPFETFVEFYTQFIKRSGEYGKKVELRVEVIAGHPGETIESTIDNVLKLKKLEIPIERVYPFVPLPMTVSACQYYTGRDPYSGEGIYVTNKMSEKEDMATLYKWDKKSNMKRIKNILYAVGRENEIKRIIPFKFMR